MDVGVIWSTTYFLNYCYSNITSISEDKYFTESQQFNKTFRNPFDSLCEGRAKIRQRNTWKKEEKLKSRDLAKYMSS